MEWRCLLLILEVYDKEKFACYWFSQEDLQDKELRKSLISEQKEWNEEGYRVCEFHSGTGDIVELTKDLLIHTKEVLAAQKAKQDTDRDR